MADERSITARLPGELVQRLEDARYYLSKTTGKRISTKALVQESLERFLTYVEAKLKNESQS
jgi:predicted DNA-binding protein